MKKFNIVVIVSILLLSACSTAPVALTKGAKEFDKQQYNAAFTDLLPLAQQGNAEAQYAIAYLYYNGLGVAKNFNSAETWFQKAADQGNTKAKKALDMIAEAKDSAPFQAPPALNDLQ